MLGKNIRYARLEDFALMDECSECPLKEFGLDSTEQVSVIIQRRAEFSCLLYLGHGEKTEMTAVGRNEGWTSLGLREIHP